MLTALGKHSLIDLKVRATGDIDIDVHHTVEDTAIVFGQALKQALGDKAGITRYGQALIPMDEALAQAAVDLSGRPYCVRGGEPRQIYRGLGQRLIHRKQGLTEIGRAHVCTPFTWPSCT